MATVRTNDLVEGISGKIDSLVFRTYNGNTIVSAKPQQPQKQSAQQKDNRSKFRQATDWAKAILLDPAKKEYYQKKAKKLKLPNAYTAAITDYMRKAKVDMHANNDGSVNCYVSKKDFEVKAITVTLRDATGGVKEIRVIDKDKYGEWSFLLSEAERLNGAEVRVVDDVGRESVLGVGELARYH